MFFLCVTTYHVYRGLITGAAYPKISRCQSTLGVFNDCVNPWNLLKRWIFRLPWSLTHKNAHILHEYVCMYIYICYREKNIYIYNIYVTHIHTYMYMLYTIHIQDIDIDVEHRDMFVSLLPILHKVHRVRFPWAMATEVATVNWWFFSHPKPVQNYGYLLGTKSRKEIEMPSLDFFRWCETLVGTCKSCQERLIVLGRVG